MTAQEKELLDAIVALKKNAGDMVEFNIDDHRMEERDHKNCVRKSCGRIAVYLFSEKINEYPGWNETIAKASEMMETHRKSIEYEKNHPDFIKALHANLNYL